MARNAAAYGLVLVAGTLAAPSPALAQPAEAAASLPADPRDLSGVWMNDNTLDETLKREGLKRLAPGASEPRPGAGNLPAFTPEYQKKFEEAQARRARLAEGAEYCKWPGMPRIMTYPYPLEILHTPGRITMIFEAESQVRRIFLDRSEHLPDEELDPSYNGDSIGHWEGNVLVVDTIGFNDETTFGRNWPHSEQMRITERIYYVDADTIHDDLTIEDPLALTRPWETTIVYSKRPDWRIREYSCEENNRDAPDASGERSGGLVDSAQAN